MEEKSSLITSDNDVVRRPWADFHPSVWGDYFNCSLPPPDQDRNTRMQRRVEMLKEEVRRMFANITRGDHPAEEQLEVVDALQRLGLTYHFQEEIGETLARSYDPDGKLVMDYEDLHAVALRFRLLRQAGYNVPSDEFNKFKDVDGHFQTSLGSDVKGLLSLYEAAYLGTPTDGEVLEEAITFCRRHLDPMLDHLQPHLKAEVARALETPLIRRMNRAEARQYITFYEATERRNDLILELAKLDFNLVQSLHQEELRKLSRWWKELGLIQKLNFARDRIVECYCIWALGTHYEPHLSCARIIMTKVSGLVSILDDLYDAYGTLEELQLLTSAIQRWDIVSIEELPNYMKIYFSALMETCKQFEDELVGEQKSYGLGYLKEEWKMLSLAYFAEAKWREEGHMPSLEEHLRVSSISTAYGLLTCASYLGLGDVTTKETFDWLITFQTVVNVSATICRLLDDIVGYENEQKRDHHVASSVQAYMNEHGVTNKMACQKLFEMIDNLWKVMNQQVLQPNAIQLQLLMSSFNLTRVMETFYKYGEGYTYSSGATKELINLLLVENICV